MAVDVDRHARIAAGAIVFAADAAQRDFRGSAQIGLLADAEARHGQLKILRAGDAPGFQHFRAEGRNRDRNVLNILRALLRGNDDFLDSPR